MTVHENGGTLTSSSMKAPVQNYGDVWFDTNAITSTLSLKNVCIKSHLTYNSLNREGDLVVHKPNGIDLHFIMHAHELHYHNTNNVD